MTDRLVIGPYGDAARAAWAEDGARMLARLEDLAGLPEDGRAAVRALGYMGHEPLGAAQMDLLPNLQVIANFGVGYDAIDVAAASARGITVTNTPDVLNDDVADLAVGMLIALNRGFEPAIRAVREGTWATQGGPPLGRRMSGRTIGILGMGRIGRAIADRLAAFGCPVHYQSRSPKDTPGDWRFHADPVELARAVDDLVIAIVGGEATRGIVSAEVLAALGADGVLVNVARGSVIDEPALIAALEAGRLRGAALDVFWNEPEVDPRLARAPNVLPLPHIGSATVETRGAMLDLQRRNLDAVLAGRPALTPVN
ncbi:2-hydroxyacid dehydrogenase [Paracoccus salipaludis]|uniref:Hydroxyacid dehydrogenase n=1 Tax=Paracoccus salipaludis TaxID=2032623 RepID=A0A2A2GGX6_9RHOB|nr:2-hydroxyacid dehydrogenase [Paracoccus salipaludis]PAU96460.1 hydroxyacid dehydrogenase [Paracoccus salipaludis]